MKTEENRKARGCLVLFIKLGVLALGVFLLVRERFDAVLRLVNPWWWSLSVLAALVVLFLIARHIYKR